MACSQDNLVLPDEGAAARIAISSGDNQRGESGAPLGDELVVLVTDALDRPVIGQSVTFAPVDGASGEVAEAAVVTDAEGHAATQWVLGPTAGTQQVRANVIVNGTAVPELSVTFSATATAGVAARLVIRTQPSQVVAGATMSPAVKVEVQDQNGNRVTGATTPVSLALSSNPGGATLSGGGAVNAVDGIATFASLSLNRTGTGYALTATAPGGFAPATSVAFDVVSAAPHHLEFSVPTAVAAGTTIVPAQVTVRDALGNIATSPSLSVTVAIQDNPAGGTLSGTKTVSTVAGIASFANLSIDRAGSGYTLQASAGGLQVKSAAFNVLPGNAGRLAFRVQPASTVVGGSLGTVEVAVLDAQGNLVTTATNSVTIGSSVTGTLSGTSTVAAVNGVARFTNLAITKAGAGYRLNAHASGLADASSDPFDIAKAATAITIAAKNPSGTSVVGQAVTVNYDVNITAPGSGSLTGSVVVTDGDATCIGGITAGTGTGSCQLTFATAGARTITATYSGDINFQGSASAGTAHTVNKASTSTAIRSDAPDPSEVEQTVVVTWAVSVTSPGSGTPTGTMTVTMAGDGATCSKPVAMGSCEITPTTAGSVRTITATYSGDDSYNGSSDAEAHVVNRAATTTTITSLTPSSSFLLQDVTVAFTVTSATSALPSDSVKVTVNGTERCRAPVSAGSCIVPGAAFPSAGTYTVVATYQGDESHSPSSDSESHTVSVLNTAPQANDDAASVDEDGSLVVSAAGGVLHNDTDAQGDNLTAALVSGPSHATAFTLNSDGSFNYIPAADFNGSDSFTYRTSDGQAESGVATVTITVTSVNDAPSFTKGTNVSVTTADGSQTISNWATGMSAGPADESGQSLAFETSTDNDALFAPGATPSIAPDGTLSFTPSGIEGTATVTVRLTDNGGIDNGGQNTSATQTFTITVGPASTP